MGVDQTNVQFPSRIIPHAFRRVRLVLLARRTEAHASDGPQLSGQAAHVRYRLPVALGHNLAANPRSGEIWEPDYQSKSVLVFAPVMSLGGGTK